MSATRTRHLAPSALVLAALALTGCQTYTAQTAQTDTAVRSGDLHGAVANIERDAERNRDNRNTILYRLEQGAILRSAALADLPVAAVAQPAPAEDGQPPLPAERQFFVRSNRALDSAERRVNRYEEEAKVRVGAEAGALLTNQANVPYRGRSYDKVMLNTYKALNYAHLGDWDNALVELNRALQRQRDAVEENARRIEESKEIAANAAKGGVKDEEGRQGEAYDVEKAKADPRSGAAFSQLEAEVDAAIKAYGDYVNPFSVFLDGLFFLYRGSDTSDLERSRVSLNRVLGMVPDNAYIRRDLEAATTGALPSGITYVLFETGAAPYRDQTRIDIPVGLLTGRISYVGAAFPKLSFVGGHSPVLAVSDGQATHNSSLVASIDSVVAQDFKNEWPSILTKTLISTATKATLDAVIQNQANNRLGLVGGLAVRVATAATQASMNIADTRTWRSLPKEFHYLRLDTPASRALTLSASGQTATVSLEPGSVNVVYVKSASQSAPLLTSQFVLKQ